MRFRGDLDDVEDKILTLSGIHSYSVMYRGKVVVLLHNESVWRSGCIDQRFRNLGISWRRVFSYTPLPLYPRGSSPGAI
jgi:hypothetical protein